MLRRSAIPAGRACDLRVLRRLGLDVEFPEEQTCCGQPMANSGCAEDARPLAERFLKIFGKYDHVVAPSGSCVSMVRNHYAQWLEGSRGSTTCAPTPSNFANTLVDVARVTKVNGDFPSEGGIAYELPWSAGNCGWGALPSKWCRPFNKVRQLLAQLKGIELIELTRPDECCGFGGTFAVNEEAVSSLMGRDRIADHVQGGAEVITGFDVSCLMHLEGIIRREKMPLRVMHVAEILEAARLS